MGQKKKRKAAIKLSQSDFNILRSSELKSSLDYIFEKNLREKEEHKEKIKLLKAKIKVNCLKMALLKKECEGKLFTCFRFQMTNFRPLSLESCF